MRHAGSSALLLALASACGDADVGRPRDLLAAVPADAAIVVSTIDWDDIRERGRENHFVELFGGETWRDVKATFDAEIRKGDGRDFDFPAAFGAVRGEAVLYFRFVGDDQKPEMGVLFEATADDVAFVRLWEGLRHLAEAEGTARRVDRDGATLHVIDGREQSVFIKGDRVYGLTISEAEIENPALAAANGMLDRLRASDDSLATSPKFRAAFAGRASNPAVRAYFDGESLFALFNRFNSQSDTETFTQLGASRMEWGAVDLDLGAGEQLELHVSVHVPADTFLGEVLGHLGRAPTDLLGSLPGSAFYAIVGEVDAVGAFRSILSFQERHAQRAHERMTRGLEELREEMGVDIERDLLAGLSGQFAGMGVPTSLSSEQMMNVTREMDRSPVAMFAAMTGGAYYVGLEDAATVKGAMGAIAARMSRGSRRLRNDVFGIPVESMGTELPVTPRWAFHDGVFVFSTNDTAMYSAAETLSGEGRGSFADLRGVSTRIAELDRASIGSIVRTRGAVDGLIGMMRSIGFAATTGYGRSSRPMATIRWPSSLVTPDLFEGYVVQTVTRDGDRLSIDIVAR